MTARTAPLVLALLVAAGCSAPPANAQLDGSWERVSTEGSPTPRHENAFVEVGGKFYLVGGRGQRPVDIFDPATGRWTTGTAAPLEIHHFQAVAFDGKIYVVGAWTDGFPDEQGIENVLIYDTAQDIWETGPVVPEARRRGAAGAVVHSDHIYVVAGNRGGHGPHATAVPWFDRFDPRLGTWEELPDAPRGRDHFHAVVVDGRLYAAGGRTSDVQGFIDSTIAEVDMYDFATNAWSTLDGSPLPTERAGTAAVGIGAYVIVTGGEGFGQAWGETEALDTRTGRWEWIGALSQPRHGTQLIAFDGKLWIAGGSGDQGGGPELVDLEACDLAD